jgi:hypothetical protein
VIAHQIPEWSYVRRQNQTPIEQIVLEDIRDPFGIPLVGFLSLDCFQIFWMSKNKVARGFENVPDRNPVFPCRFHADILTVVASQPCGKPTQVTRECGKAFIGGVCGNKLLIGCCDTRHHKRFVDINSTADGVNDFRHNSLPQNYLRKQAGTGRSHEKRVVSLSKDKFTGYSAHIYLCLKERPVHIFIRNSKLLNALTSTYSVVCLSPQDKLNRFKKKCTPRFHYRFVPFEERNGHIYAREQFSICQGE